MGGAPIQFLDVKVGNLLQQRVISLQTEQVGCVGFLATGIISFVNSTKGAEISRLLGQYIYVDSQSRGFIQGEGGNIL